MLGEIIVFVAVLGFCIQSCTKIPSQDWAPWPRGFSCDFVPVASETDCARPAGHVTEIPPAAASRFLDPGRKTRGSGIATTNYQRGQYTILQYCDFVICRECPGATFGGYQLGLADSPACSCNLVQSVWSWPKGPKLGAQTEALRGCCGEPTESRSESMAGVFETRIPVDDD